MANFPEVITVGLRAGGTNYLLQSDSLLEFHGLQTEEDGIRSLLKGFGLPAGDLKVHQRTERGLMRLPQEHVAAFARKLQERGATTRVGPIYYEEGKGTESAASPITGAISLELQTGASGEAVAAWLGDRGYVTDPTFSPLVAPCLYFYRPVGSPPLIDPDPGTLLSEVRSRPEVMSADFDWVKLNALAAQPQDPSLSDLQLPTLKLIRMDQILPSFPPASYIPVEVAILDSGFDFNHPDLVFAPQAQRLDLVDQQKKVEGGTRLSTGNPEHGTAVAGVAVAIIGNGIGIAGIAGGCPIVPVSLGNFPSAVGLVAGLRWAVTQGVRVVNMSVSIVGIDCANEALKAAWDAGLVLCAAAGNSGQSSVDYPASHPNVIGVGGANTSGLRKTHDTDFCGTIDWESQYGSGLSVLAPGQHCWTTYPPQSYQAVCGTSIASPHAAGLAALIRSVNPQLGNTEVRGIIETTCQKVGTYSYSSSPATNPNGTWSDQAGYGLIDCNAALNAAIALLAMRPPASGGRGGRRKTASPSKTRPQSLARSALRRERITPR